MPRRVVEDIRPGERRSVRDISVVAPKAEKVKREAIRQTEAVVPPAKEIIETSLPIHVRRVPAEALSGSRPGRSGAKRSLTTVLVVLGIFLVIIAVGYFASAHFARAIFTLVPRTVPVTVNGPIVAFGVPQAGQLSYILESESLVASTTVPASDGPDIETKASGTVMIYNAYSATPWRLIAGTRLVNDVGNVYRLGSSITIPGYKKALSGNVVPGQLKATILADQPGARFNVSRTDPGNTFMIVAYASSTKYSAIYGKTVGNITGGFSGSKKTVSAAVLASTTAALKADAAARLTARLKASLSSDRVIFDQGLIRQFSEPEIAGDQPKKAIVSMRATVYALTFDKIGLLTKLAGAQSVKLFDGAGFDAVGLDKMSFSLTNIKDFSPEKKSNAVIQMKGDMKLVGIIPVDKLKASFAGLSLSDTKEAMLKYSSVIDLEKSSGQIVPPWAKIPGDPSKVEIIVQK